MSRLNFTALGPEVRIEEFAGGAILYDSSRASNATCEWFDASWWSQRGTVSAAAEGRGAASLIEADGRSLVLRHYRRGGLITRLSADRYWWRGAERTRSFMEWRLLYHMQRAGLAVPVPIAAGYHRYGRIYSADLLVERIPAVRSLAAAVRSVALPLASWVAIGRALSHLHTCGICHADLNAHNILLGTAENAIWFIDFDRGSVRNPGWWRDANLVRLHRSLQKITAGLGAEQFAAADWQALLDSYIAATLAAREQSAA